MFGAIVILPAVLAHKGRSGGRIALTVIGGIAVLLNLISLVTQGNLWALVSTKEFAKAHGLTLSQALELGQKLAEMWEKK